MHVITTTRKVGEKVYRCHMLCHSYREGGKVKKEVLANISKLPDDIIEVSRRALKGDLPKALTTGESDATATPPIVTESRNHGQVMVVMEAMNRLGIPKLIAKRASPERSKAHLSL